MNIEEKFKRVLTQLNEIEIFEYEKPTEHFNYNKFTNFCRQGKKLKIIL